MIWSISALKFNRKIFPIYGIYDYYRMKKDEYAENFIKASIYTIRVNLLSVEIKMSLILSRFRRNIRWGNLQGKVFR